MVAADLVIVHSDRGNRSLKCVRCIFRERAMLDRFLFMNGRDLGGSGLRNHLNKVVNFIVPVDLCRRRAGFHRLALDLRVLRASTV